MTSVAQGPFNLVAGQTLSLQPPSPVGWAGATITNLSPFPLEVNSAAVGSLWIDPFTSNFVALDSGNTPIQVVPAAYASAVTNPQAQVTWFTEPPAGYPYTLNTIASTVQTPDVILLPATAVTANPVSATGIVVPTLTSIHALGFFWAAPVSGTYHGLSVAIVGVTSTITYYAKRSLANADISSLHFELFPFSNALDQSLTMTVTATGGPGGATFGLVGFSGTPPAYTPPIIPSQLASATQAGAGTATLLAPLADGRQYQIFSVSLEGISTNAGAGFQQGVVQTHSGSLVRSLQIKDGQAGRNDFVPANGLIVPSLDLVNNGGATETFDATVTYLWA